MLNSPSSEGVSQDDVLCGLLQNLVVLQIWVRKNSRIIVEHGGLILSYTPVKSRKAQTKTTSEKQALSEWNTIFYFFTFLCLVCHPLSALTKLMEGFRSSVVLLCSLELSACVVNMDRWKYFLPLFMRQASTSHLVQHSSSLNFTDARAHTTKLPLSVLTECAQCAYWVCSVCLLAKVLCAVCSSRMHWHQKSLSSFRQTMNGCVSKDNNKTHIHSRHWFQYIWSRSFLRRGHACVDHPHF